MPQTKTKTIAKVQLQDISLDISWARFAKEYFGKSASWIYNKLNGIDGNGGVGEFTEAEKETLKTGLYDLASRLKKAADEFD